MPGFAFACAANSGGGGNRRTSLKSASMASFCVGVDMAAAFVSAADRPPGDDPAAELPNTEDDGPLDRRLLWRPHRRRDERAVLCRRRGRAAARAHAGRLLRAARPSAGAVSR